VKIASVYSARPDFTKLAPIHKTVSKFVDHTSVQAVQHYNYQLSEIFFKEFHLPKSDYNLKVDS